MSESLLLSPSLYYWLHCWECISKEEMFWSKHRMEAGGNTKSRKIWQTEIIFFSLLYCNLCCFVPLNSTSNSLLQPSELCWALAQMWDKTGKFKAAIPDLFISLAQSFTNPTPCVGGRSVDVSKACRHNFVSARYTCNPQPQFQLYLCILNTKW